MTKTCHLLNLPAVRETLVNQTYEVRGIAGHRASFDSRFGEAISGIGQLAIIHTVRKAGQKLRDIIQRFFLVRVSVEHLGDQGHVVVIGEGAGTDLLIIQSAQTWDLAIFRQPVQNNLLECGQGLDRLGHEPVNPRGNGGVFGPGIPGMRGVALESSSIN